MQYAAPSQWQEEVTLVFSLVKMTQDPLTLRKLSDPVFVRLQSHSKIEIHLNCPAEKCNTTPKDFGATFLISAIANQVLQSMSKVTREVVPLGDPDFLCHSSKFLL